jgi:DNA primase
MVVSISKIPDRIQRNLYSECSRIMDISEQVLQSTLLIIQNTELLK